MEKNTNLPTSNAKEIANVLLREGVGGVVVGYVSAVSLKMVSDSLWKALIPSKVAVVVTDVDVPEFIPKTLSFFTTILGCYLVAIVNPIPKRKMTTAAGILAYLIYSNMSSSVVSASAEIDLSIPVLPTSAKSKMVPISEDIMPFVTNVDTSGLMLETLEYVRYGKDILHIHFSDKALRLQYYRSTKNCTILITDGSWQPLNFNDFKDIVIKAISLGLKMVYFFAGYANKVEDLSYTQEVVFLNTYKIKSIVMTASGQSANPNPLFPEKIHLESQDWLAASATEESKMMASFNELDLEIAP